MTTSASIVTPVTSDVRITQDPRLPAHCSLSYSLTLDTRSRKSADSRRRPKPAAASVLTTNSEWQALQQGPGSQLHNSASSCCQKQITLRGRDPVGKTRMRRRFSSWQGWMASKSASVWQVCWSMRSLTTVLVRERSATSGGIGKCRSQAPPTRLEVQRLLQAASLPSGRSQRKLVAGSPRPGREIRVGSFRWILVPYSRSR